jgi:hypothetical protein
MQLSHRNHQIPAPNKIPILSSSRSALITRRAACAAAAAAAAAGQPAVAVGPFVFDEAVLGWACAEVLAGLDRRADYVVLDELGPLEARRGLGLAPALQRCLERADGGDGGGGTAVIAVVREGIRPALLARFGVAADGVGELDLAAGPP